MPFSLGGNLQPSACIVIGRTFQNFLSRSCFIFVQRKSRAQGVLGQDECISALRLVYQNQPEVTLVREEPLAIACRMLQDTGGEHWQMHGPGVWPRIVAVVGKKKRRSQLAEERDGGQDDVDVPREEPGSAEEEGSAKRQRMESVDKQGERSSTMRGGSSKRCQLPKRDRCDASQGPVSRVRVSVHCFC
jgi:hypothetical protein